MIPLCTPWAEIGGVRWVARRARIPKRHPAAYVSKMLGREFVPSPLRFFDKKDFLFVPAGNRDAVPVNLSDHFAQQCASHPKREQVADRVAKRERLKELELVVASKQCKE
jgi:hypothetical protein